MNNFCVDKDTGLHIFCQGILVKLGDKVEGASGVYFGPDNNYNLSSFQKHESFHDEVNQSRVELTAFLDGLRLAKLVHGTERLNLLVIHLESYYVWDGFYRLSVWKSNGWSRHSRKKKKVAHLDLWKSIDYEIHEGLKKFAEILLFLICT
jgi:ribonuclease HI